MKQNTSHQIDNPYQTKQIMAAILMIAFVAFLFSRISIGWSLLWLASYSVWAIICSQMAKSRGRSLAGGIVGGYFFGLFAVLYYLIASDSVEMRVIKEEAARRKHRID